MSFFIPLLFSSLLALLALATFTIAKGYENYRSDGGDMLEHVKEMFGDIDPSLRNIPIKEGNSSYTENKRTITLCLKDPETKKMYDKNTIAYVSLHELAHIISKNQGHGEEFKRNFSMLLSLVQRLGYYNPNISIPDTYCGT